MFQMQRTRDRWRTNEWILRNPRCIAVQFRYGFITDDDGLKIVDLYRANTAGSASAFDAADLNHAAFLRRADLRIRRERPGRSCDCRCRKSRTTATRANVQCRRALNDTRAVQIGSVSASEFALVADGRNGLRVVQLISPDTVPGAQGFSPRPNPKLIATYPTKGENDLCLARLGARSRG